MPLNFQANILSKTDADKNFLNIILHYMKIYTSVFHLLSLAFLLLQISIPL